MKKIKIRWWKIINNRYDEKKLKIFKSISLQGNSVKISLTWRIKKKIKKK